MGKNGAKGKGAELGYSFSDGHMRQNKGGVNNSPRAQDKDMELFIVMAQELKEEGNKLFQRRDLEGAMLKYEKAINLLPRNHIDVSLLRSNLATCYMQMGLGEYPKAIRECNLALEATPKYAKALLKRARCYEALNRLDFALRDVSTVIKMEPNNCMASEVLDRVKAAIEEKGLVVTDATIELPPDYVEPPIPSPVIKDKPKRRKSKKMQLETPVCKEHEENMVDPEKNAEDKLVVEEKIKTCRQEEPKRTIKLVFEEDIRWAQVPLSCSLSHLKDVIHERFPDKGQLHIKFRDQEGDLVSIASDDELKIAAAAADSQGSLRLYLVQTKPAELNKQSEKLSLPTKNGDIEKDTERENKPHSIDEWIVEFAKLFKEHIGLDSDAYLGLHEVGMKAYSEAMEETVTSNEAQGIFDSAAGTFQEMAALAMFNWGNVHMSRAKKKVHVDVADGGSREKVLGHIKCAYDWAQKEYSLARRRYEEALRIKPDFYEGFLALGQQQFEQARLTWYYALSSKVDLESWPSDHVIQLYNCAEDNMERGMKIWEEFEEQCLKRQPALGKTKLQMVEFDGLFEDMPVEEADKHAKSIKSQINVLWGTMLYERSVMEFKLGVPVWQECLEVAIEKFVLAGASPTDITVMIKNHISNDSALEGLGFRIDEIVQAWNEMYEAKKQQSRVPSFRIEPLLLRRISKLHHSFELA